MADVEFIDNRVVVKRALEDAVGKYLIEASGELVGKSARNSRVKSGQTKGSYKANVDENNGTAYIGSNLENAIWEEFGTGEYALHGDGRKGGWVYQAPKGEFYFTKGKKPNRPMHNAFTALKNKLIKRYADILRSKIGGR